MDRNYSGFVGIVASSQKTECWIIVFLILSILASVMCIPLLVFSAINLSIDLPYTGPLWHNMDVIIGLNITLLIISIAEGIMAIISSGLACYGSCYNMCPVMAAPHQMQHIQVQGGQFVLIPVGKQLMSAGGFQQLMVPAGPSTQMQVQSPEQPSQVRLMQPPSYDMYTSVSTAMKEGATNGAYLQTNNDAAQ